jgi:DNA-binding HxlR family transcriptional regulator
MSQVRPGAFTLSLLSAPINVHLLEALEGEPRGLSDLRRAAGGPAPTTMRKQLGLLTDLEVVTRRRQADFPGSVEFELGPAGPELLEVTRLLQGWLSGAPEGPVPIGSAAAKNALKALVDGWETKIVRALAACPLSLTDLNRLISAFNYPYLERRFSALRACGLIEPRPGEGRRTLYAPSRWLQRACGPLMAAAHWERRHAAEHVATERFDFEAAFLLGALGASLPDDASGRCRLAVEFRNGSGEPTLAGVQLQVVEGEVLTCAARPEGNADAFASGPSSAWVRALTSGRPDELYLSGDRRLATEIVEALHRELFRSRQPA